MPQYTDSGLPRKSVYKTVAASQTTANISTPNDAVKGRDYLERVIITAATTLVGAVSVFDGGTTILTHNAQVTGFTGSNVTIYDIGITANTTAGFNVTTGSSVTCVCIGNF
jgi:hypothetical protein